MDLDVAAQQLAERIRGLGAAGPVVLFALFVLQCVVAPLPSEPLMMAGGYVYGPRLGGLIAWAGVVLGAGCCFGIARLFGRPFAERFVRAERLREVDRFADGRGRVAVFLALLGIRVFAFTSFEHKQQFDGAPEAYIGRRLDRPVGFSSPYEGFPERRTTVPPMAREV